MRTLFLPRFASSSKGTFGVFLYEYKIPICQTVELPWDYNKEDMSCIKEGCYICERDYSGKYKGYKILDVYGRKNIEIHPANTILDLKGCIGVANGGYGKLHNLPSIRKGKVGFNEFMNFMEGIEKFKLVIKNFWEDI